MEIQLANKLWNAVGAKQSWSSKCDFLQNIWRKMKLWWGQGHSVVQSLDKNTILGLNTKFSFMNYKITVSGSKCFYFFFFFVVNYWLICLLLTFPLCMETRWMGIFQKLCYQLFQCCFVSLKKELFPVSLGENLCRLLLELLCKETVFPVSSIFLQILILEMDLWWSLMEILVGINFSWWKFMFFEKEK